MAQFARRLMPSPSTLVRRVAAGLTVVTAAGAFAVAAAPSADAAPLQFTSVVNGIPRPDGQPGYGDVRALIGDFNGDGIGDAAYASQTKTTVVYGSRSAPADVDLTQDLGTRVTTYTSADQAGFNTVAKAGDVDHDGKADLLITALNATYVVYGSSLVAGQTIPVASPAGIATITTRAGGTLGAKGIGDFNGDGIDDLGVERGDQGLAIVSGGPRITTLDSNTQSARVSLVNATQTCAWIFFQYHCVYNGVGVEPIGDFNGDGKTDIAISNKAASGNQILFGRAGGFSVSSVLTSGFTRLPTAASGQLNQIDGLGDVNGDGLGDLLLYNEKIIFGRRTTATTIPSNDPQVTLVPGATNSGLVQAVGDQNGDGKDDFVAYMYGSPTGPLKLVTDVPAPPATIDLEAEPGLALPAGRAVGYMAGGGDIDGDGIGDLLVSQFSFQNSFVLTHGDPPSAGAGGPGGAPPAPATLDTQLTVVSPYGRPVKSLRIVSSADCPMTVPSLYGQNGVRQAFVADGLQSGDVCKVTISADFITVVPNQFIYTDCDWTQTLSINGVQQPDPAADTTPQPTLTLVPGENHVTETRTCKLPNDPDYPTAIVSYGWNSTGSAYGGGGGGDQVVAKAAANQVGSVVWRAPLNFNDKTISFTLRNSGGNGAGEGATLAFLRDDPASDGSDPLGGYLGVGGGQLGFGGLRGIALAFDENQQPGEPSSNFIGWTASASTTGGLLYAQTADPGVSLRSNAGIAVKVASKGGVVSVYINGALRMTRTLRLPNPGHLAFTASNGTSTYENHVVPASGFKITTS